FLLINASSYFVKEKPKNKLTDEGIAAVAKVFHEWSARDKLSRVATLDDMREADYNLSPSLFVDTNDRVHHRALSEIIKDLRETRAKRENADSALESLIKTLGIEF